MLLTTFLSVLKIIGIVLLVILAVLLVLLLLVLFVPICYRADATVPETELDDGFDAEKVIASARFSWLWFVIRGGIDHPENKQFTLRVFGIKILPKKEKPEKPDKKKKKGEESETGTEAEPETKPEDTVAEVKPYEANSQAPETSTEADTQTTVESSFDTSSESESGSEEEKAQDEPKSILDVIWKIIDAVDNFLKTPLNVFEKIRCTISRVCDKIEMIKATLENDIFKRAFELTKRKLIWVLKKSLPRKCDVKVMFGSGDPASTAEIMAAYGALYPVLYKKVEYTPDFERKVVKADVHLKGRLTLFVFLYAVAVCFFNKDVKKTIRRFKKIINS